MEIKIYKNNRYCILGSGKIDIVIELGIATSIGEWYSTALKFSQKKTILIYERSRDINTSRTPEIIANELEELLSNLECNEKIIIIAHSQGGLYASQYARLYPNRLKGLILIDPLSPFDNRYKDVLNPEEQKKSGFDKSANLVLMSKFAKLHLGFIIKMIMRKAPPFYYYKGFNKEESKDILSNLTKPNMSIASLSEYNCAHDENNLITLKTKEGFPQIPLILITHNSEFLINEIMMFGQTDRPLAEKAENLWQDIMKEYLAFSDKSTFIQAKNSGHYIHLTEPELITQALDLIK